MAGRSKVYDLSPELREEINRLLRDRVPLDRIVAHLKGLTADEAELPSRSSIGRYAQQFEAISARIQRSQDITDRLVAQIGPQVADGKGLQVLAQGFQSLAFDMLAGMGEDQALDPENLMFFAKSIKDLSSALKTDADRSLAIQKEALKKAVGAVKQAAGEKGLSQETADFIMAKVLGVAG
ncbi:MAG TPA: phage protein Gp27 family protein [Caulobacteraceae bacterium]|nr:phage protein Gp27 family protein [Caulobacteraceae bacterium]